ncbi:hypothetical protein RIEPE_0504 [Candidatus Riesia pediculicola USDA]|uniref:Uncharacterized protein n=1 Tax=Riesia pediculicola (strain USDA) TaxID=515618 RepID=D4G8T2_RIEPU|nr:hypothetical protein RIEPE_0504 [Candidatus Riesia pediculicola USDA]
MKIIFQSLVKYFEKFQLDRNSSDKNSSNILKFKKIENY